MGREGPVRWARGAVEEVRRVGEWWEGVPRRVPGAIGVVAGGGAGAAGASASLLDGGLWAEVVLVTEVVGAALLAGMAALYLVHRWREG